MAGDTAPSCTTASPGSPAREAVSRPLSGYAPVTTGLGVIDARALRRWVNPRAPSGPTGMSTRQPTYERKPMLRHFLTRFAVLGMAALVLAAVFSTQTVRASDVQTRSDVGASAADNRMTQFTSASSCLLGRMPGPNGTCFGPSGKDAQQCAKGAAIGAAGVQAGSTTKKILKKILKRSLPSDPEDPSAMIPPSAKIVAGALKGCVDASYGK
jgi:hypothetical protein